jgi:raffinose/stachyose/melibiose transport system permease protein
MMTPLSSRAAYFGAVTGRHAVLIAASIIFGYPILWMVFGALKTPNRFYSNVWGPDRHIQWANFADAWSTGKLGAYYVNSIIITGTTIATMIVLVYPLAYAIARLQFPGSRAVLAVFAVCLFVPFGLTIIPLFDLVYRLHLYNTYFGLILPAVSAHLPFAVIFTTAYLRTLPKEIEEASTIDGAGAWRTMLSIAVPLSVPAFATIVVVTFLGVWNDLLVPLTLAQSDSVRTLPVGLINFQEATGPIEYPSLFAALTVSAVPIIAIFLLCQRQFLNGLVAGAVKQ